MIINIRIAFGILLAAIFAVLSLLHVYWLFGGRFASEAVVPVVDGKRAINPSSFTTVLVAAALLLATLVILGEIGLFKQAFPKWVFRWGALGISLIFFLRAVGDFRLVGFFKRVTDTTFAYWDTWLFSPLCLFISITAFMLVYTEPQ